MNNEVQSGVDLFYVTFVSDTEEEAISLTEYLIAHGIEAILLNTTETQITMTNPSKMHYIWQLKRSWVDFFHHHQSRLFDIPVYIKRS